MASQQSPSPASKAHDDLSCTNGNNGHSTNGVRPHHESCGERAVTADESELGTSIIDDKDSSADTEEESFLLVLGDHLYRRGPGTTRACASQLIHAFLEHGEVGKPTIGLKVRVHRICVICVVVVVCIYLLYIYVCVSRSIRTLNKESAANGSRSDLKTHTLDTGKLETFPPKIEMKKQEVGNQTNY